MNYISLNDHVHQAAGIQVFRAGQGGRRAPSGTERSLVGMVGEAVGWEE